MKCCFGKSSPSKQPERNGSANSLSAGANASVIDAVKRRPSADNNEAAGDASHVPLMPGIQKNTATLVSRAHDPNIKIEDEYVIDKQGVLGTGFCGSVFMAKHKVSGEQVAVKTLRKSDCQDGDETLEEVMLRVRSECEIYLNCDHPNIARLRDMYETETHIYLVCDCCTGGELYDRLLKRGQYAERDASQATKGMLLAVSYIHNTLNIVHRDLKLQNWLFPTATSPDDSIKLIDFGFSKLIEKKTAANKPLLAVTAGTVEYLAPELLFHESQVRFPGDMWAMGIIVFMMLGGYPPFSGKNNAEIIAAIRNNEIKWFRSRWDKVSAQAKEITLGMLNRDPDKRLTAIQALNHPWIVSNTSQNSLLSNDVLVALKGFSQKTSFEKATAMIMVQCLAADEVSQMERLFVQLDKTHEGSVQMWELKEALEKYGGAFGTSDVEQIFKELDYNKDQYIYFSDFLTAVVSNKIRDRSDELLRATFDRFDVDNSGKISLANLHHLFGDKFRDTTVEEMMNEVDLNGDKTIDYDEFKAFILKKQNIDHAMGEVPGMGPGAANVVLDQVEGGEQDQALIEASHMAALPGCCFQDGTVADVLSRSGKSNGDMGVAAELLGEIVSSRGASKSSGNQV